MYSMEQTPIAENCKCLSLNKCFLKVYKKKIDKTSEFEFVARTFYIPLGKLAILWWLTQAKVGKVYLEVKASLERAEANQGRRCEVTTLKFKARGY